jgi:hypothetical protein
VGVNGASCHYEGFFGVAVILGPNVYTSYALCHGSWQIWKVLGSVSRHMASVNDATSVNRTMSVNGPCDAQWRSLK